MGNSPSRTLLARLAVPLLALGFGAGAISVSASAASTGAGVEPTSKTQSAVPPAKVHWTTCARYVPNRARCGHIMVSADPARPALGLQRVGFEFYKRKRPQRPSLGTLVGNEGGPGYPSTGSRSYYLGLFRPMSNRHDILLVDQRGTGTSGVLRCPELQRATLPWVKAVTACGEQLGKRSAIYSTAYAADDLAAVLDSLKMDEIDLYGDSYGTFFAQTFALRHRDRVRTLVLDASYPVSGQDPWWRDTNRAIQNALNNVCSRDPDCASIGGSPVTRLRRVAQYVHDRPLKTRGYNADGKRTSVTVNGVNLALVTAYATYGTSNYRELDAAVRAFKHGYEDPLVRMVAENVTDDFSGGAPSYYSAGQYVAVICSDYPQLWDTSVAPGKARKQQYRDAVADVQTSDPQGFDPFRADDWIKSGWTEPRTCIGWPTPKNQILPEEPGTTYPSMPTLVLSGDLDSVTSPEGGIDVAGRFPNATFVSVPNVGHVVALGDRQGCAAGIVRRFVRTGGTVGDTSCVSDYVPVRTVPRFARTQEGLQPATQGQHMSSSPADRRVVSAALYASGDAITRWWNNYSGHGVGLRGGTFRYSGHAGVVTFTLRNLAFVRDVRVTGEVQWDRNSGRVQADLAVDGPGRRDGRLAARWNDWQDDAQAKVSGRIGRRPVELRTDAP